jgi:TPR repeat protein
MVFLTAKEGYLFAYTKLAECYRYGQGVEKDINEAINWYKEAVKEGIIDAKFELSLLFASV